MWLVGRVDWSEVGRQLQSINGWWLGWYVVFQLSGNVISTCKWQIISGFKGIHFTLYEGFFAYLTGAFINNFLPSTIGGDAYRASWLARRTHMRTSAFSTVLFDRLSGLWTTSLFALFLSPWLYWVSGGNAPFFIAVSLLIGFFVINVLLVFLCYQQWFRVLFGFLPWNNVRHLLEEVIFYTKKHILWSIIRWSVLFIVVGIGLSNLMLFWALGSNIHPVSFLSIIFLVTIVSAIPLSINNIGIKEWAYVTFFGLVGISVETAITVALLSRFLQMVISFIALPRYLRKENGVV